MKSAGKPLAPIMPLTLPGEDSVLGGTPETPGCGASMTLRRAIPELPDSTCTDDTLHTDAVRYSTTCTAAVVSEIGDFEVHLVMKAFRPVNLI
jgi:hypothetical protein